MADHNETPDQRIKREGTAASTSGSSAKVCLGANGGYFELSWNVQTVGSDDFVALYSDPSQPVKNYLYRQWTNVSTNSGSYQTGTNVNDGYNARYVTWDTGTSAWVAIASTPAYNSTQCSS